MPSDPPSIAIVGFGAFGQLIARHLRDRFPICICDPATRSNDLPQVHLRRAAGCEIVILAVPLSQMQPVLEQIAPCLRPGATVIDVASVKIEPARLMQQILPDHVQIVATHPLFGPQSAARGLSGHRIAWCPLRGQGQGRIAAFLRRMGLQVIRTTPDSHDREMAIVQGLTHLIARSLQELGPMPARLTTASFRRMLDAAAMVQADSPELLQTILQQNPHAAATRSRFLAAAARLATDQG